TPRASELGVDVWAWGRGLESWLVDHVVIEGGPDRHDAWDQLTALLDRSWPHENGAHLRIARLAIDTGYEAPAVYAWSRKVGFAQVAPVKGLEGFNRSSPVSGPPFVDATEGRQRRPRGARPRAATPRPSTPGRARSALRRSRQSRGSKASIAPARSPAPLSWMRPRAGSACVAAPDSGRCPSRPSRPKPTASCDWSARRPRNVT